mmetsp:Transcript_17424/g.29774  ORF Transcript_17424/g.29774 Transcript_17424/m.29774 type:complete len:280 (+) Transcript_17424:141-980(+)
MCGWKKVVEWDADGDGELIDFRAMTQDAAENIALVVCSKMCREGMGYTREDHPKLKDAEFLIDANADVEELEGLLEFIVNSCDKTILPGVLLGFHASLDESWQAFVKPSTEDNTKRVRHAVLGPWEKNELLQGLVNTLVHAWKNILTARCEKQDGDTPPQELLSLLVKFEKFMADWGRTDGVVWPLLEAEKSKEESCKQDEEERKKEERKKKRGKQPGVNCCYECLGKIEEQWVSDDAADYVWSKKEEGYKYPSNVLEECTQIGYCKKCYEEHMDELRY